MATTNQVAAETIPDEIARAIVLPASYADLDGVVFPACQWLRDNAPIARAEVEGYDPLWLIAKHADVQTVMRDAELFHNADVNIMLQPQAGDQYLRNLLNGTTRVLENLSYMDPPEHGLYRNATAFEFLPAQVRRFDPRFREIAKEAVDRLMTHEGECDFVAELAARYPLNAVLEMLGVPPEDYELMLKLTQDTFGGDDSDWRRDDVPPTPEAMAKQWHASVQDFYDYFEVIRKDRLANPREDLATALVSAKLENGEAMPERVQNHLTASIALAGHDTTNSAISAGMHGLAMFPEEFERVKADPKLIGGLVDESLRWATPAKHFMRNATRDTELGGVEIKTMDRLMCLFVSANRDEAVFPEPMRFDITRRPNPHLSFSYGPHVCLGQHIAKMEMRALFAELIPRLGSVELSGPPTLKVSNFVSGFKTLPIRFTAA
ncbi:MAG: alpha-terpineol hydroxylase [Chloroflexota bacterium]|nr:alpha-terpineol hydroxylase [Chloroflexota bacterium]